MESKRDAVLGFQGAYRFLSNFYPCPVLFDGIRFKSSEAAYQASKAPIGEEWEQDTVKFAELDAREARRAGRSLRYIRQDWDATKLNIMYRILRAKFTQNLDLKQKLVATGDTYLEETNYWHDTFWGIYNGVGENHLGRLLMVVRDEINERII